MRKQYRIRLGNHGYYSPKRVYAHFVGDYLESLATLALQRLGRKAQRCKTNGLDIMTTSAGKRKDVVVECTNWAKQSWYNRTYYNKKVNALYSHLARGCIAVWIITFKSNFPNFRGNPQTKGIRIIELRKQLLPKTTSLKDYLKLKRLLKKATR